MLRSRANERYLMQTQTPFAASSPSTSTPAAISTAPANSCVSDTADHPTVTKSQSRPPIHTDNPFDQQAQFELTRHHFECYASFGACPPQPDRDGIHYEHLDYPYCGQYAGSGLTTESERRMRQAFDLQVWLALDAMAMPASPPQAMLSAGTATTARAFNQESSLPSSSERSTQPTTEVINSYRVALQNKRDALAQLQQVQLGRLRDHVSLSQGLYGMLQLMTLSSDSTTELPPDCLALMDKASIGRPVTMSPLGLYKSLCRRLLVQEEEIVAVGLELLRDELQLTRISFYAVTCPQSPYQSKFQKSGVARLTDPCIGFTVLH